MGVARVQDSATGVFLSADSLISDPGYTQSYNRYGYVNNNPLSYNDPSGHCPHNNGYTPPDNNGPGYELEEVVVYAYIDDSRSADSSSWDFTPFDWALLRDWYNDYFNNNNVDSAPAKRAPVPQTPKTGQCFYRSLVKPVSNFAAGAAAGATYSVLTGQVTPAQIAGNSLLGGVVGVSAGYANSVGDSVSIGFAVGAVATGRAGGGEAAVDAVASVAENHSSGAWQLPASYAAGAARGATSVSSVFGSSVSRSVGASIGGRAGVAALSVSLATNTIMQSWLNNLVDGIPGC